jgi:hypothetical protein
MRMVATLDVVSITISRSSMILVEGRIIVFFNWRLVE